MDSKNLCLGVLLLGNNGFYGDFIMKKRNKKKITKNDELNQDKTESLNQVRRRIEDILLKREQDKLFELDMYY
ncbi:hypothetical protein FLL98_14450 [Vibrio cholerae]|uniref:hypothetical protein n=1 Tax=Vibrio cholerae TaxID=666 RepID=UPI00115AFC00|nr:hypothetical protein [Vibrio cholerae]EGR0539267.1 hypothetical protein [Vibrio cholerae]EJL6446592.1 hypothetical protein [Vibrio cholerae]TQP52345.1 hypothetical protein FLL98_14450 [Vibrio cholerae]TQP81866.1 hypothetical protein FLL89_12520 [Vibrio cholerae]TQP87853.1 hypothetical protein FLL74_11265 [Vibrio cholerae]